MRHAPRFNRWGILFFMMSKQYKGKTAKHVSPEQKAASRIKSNANLIPLKPGYDPNRNLKGRPKSHDELKDLIQAILNEPIDADGTTRLEEMIRDMVMGEARDRTNLLEHGWGKVKEEIDATIHGAIPVQAVDYNESIKAMKPTDAVDE